MAAERFEQYLFGRFESRERPIGPEDVTEIVREARAAQRQLGELPQGRILDILDAVGRRWRDPQYPGRRAALRHMPELVGFSPLMVEMALDALCDFLRRDSLERKIRLELGDPSRLEGWRYEPAYQGYQHCQALGVVLHVSAGNVFVGGADSVVHGLLTRNANLLKVSRADPLFPLLFARSLQEVDVSGVLASSVAVLSFRGGERPVEDAFKATLDGIVVWGGKEAVASWRQDLPLGCRLVAYGPKYSFSVITAQAMQAVPLDEICRAVARDVVLWEQRACSSPQTIFVEEEVDAFVRGLAVALEAEARSLPQGRLAPDEQIEILKHRELARMAQSFGEATLLSSPQSTDWTIIRERALDLRVSPLNRTIYVKGYTRWECILEEVEKQRGYLQTVGLLGAPSEVKMMSTDLVHLGVDRITEPGRMGLGKPGSPHDGSYQLHDLVRQVCIESVRERFDLGNSLVSHREAPRKWARVEDLLNFVTQHSPFYAQRLTGLCLERPADFQQIPYLEKADIYKHTPPQGEGLLTAPLEQAYVFASGGSTGEPKFTFYSYEEFSHVTTLLADIYEVAGLKSGDVVGNLFMAGNLWTSFIVANEALEKIGCVTLPIAGNAEIELIIRYLKLFRPTALLGLPSIMIQLAENVKALGLSDLRVRTVLYGGEHMGPEARLFLSEALGCETIISAGYASVDAGPVGYQCRQSAGTVHHLLYNYQFLEIVDPDTGFTVPHGEVGEIVVTNLERRLMPMVRFRTGDLARRMSNTCDCGRVGPRFELLGRCDDVVRVGSVSIYASEIEAVVAKCPDVSHLFQVVAERVGTRDRLVLRLELPPARPAPPDGSALLARSVERILLTENLELAEALREGWLGELRVDILPAGGIPRIKRTGKIRKVVDLRGEAPTASQASQA